MVRLLFKIAAAPSVPLARESPSTVAPRAVAHGVAGYPSSARERPAHPAVRLPIAE